MINSTCKDIENREQRSDPKSDFYVSRDVRQKIEETLLLPVPKSDEIK